MGSDKKDRLPLRLKLFIWVILINCAVLPCVAVGYIIVVIDRYRIMEERSEILKERTRLLKERSTILTGRHVESDAAPE
jgi:hypothetical protein